MYVCVCVCVCVSFAARGGRAWCDAPWLGSPIGKGMLLWNASALIKPHEVMRWRLRIGALGWWTRRRPTWCLICLLHLDQATEDDSGETIQAIKTSPPPPPNPLLPLQTIGSQPHDQQAVTHTDTHTHTHTRMHTHTHLMTTMFYFCCRKIHYLTARWRGITRQPPPCHSLLGQLANITFPAFWTSSPTPPTSLRAPRITRRVQESSLC